MGTALIVILATVFVLWFFLSPAPPVVGRRKSLRDAANWTPRLSMMVDGSVLTVTDDGSRRSFQIVKENDTGLPEQRVSLQLSEQVWGTPLFEAVDRILRSTHPSAVILGGSPSDRVLRCSLTGQPISMEFLVHDLLVGIAPAMGISEDHSLSLRLDGGMNSAIWRRVNALPLQSMTAREQPWLWRVFGRYQLKRHAKERQKLSKDGE